MGEEMKSFGSLLPEIYKDAAQPTVRSAGKALGLVAELVFYPFGRCAEITKKNVSKFLDKFDGEEQTNIVEPETSIAVPVLQKLSYTEEEELVELYSELLKKSCLKDRRDKVLPSYVNLISNLTSDEVMLIDYLFNVRYIIYLLPDLRSELLPEILEAHEYEKNSKGELPFASSRLPFLEIRDQHQSKDEWISRIRYFTDIVSRVNFQKPENIELYFDNLKALGILEIRDDRYITPIEVYDHLENNKEILVHKAAIEEQGRNMVLIKGIIQFTNLGLSFLEACKE